jgi:hypothetical protein
MKKIYTILVVLITVFSSSAQVKLDDFGRIILNTYLPENLALPTEAKNLLNTKLNQITSNNGMGGSQINPRFIITANVNVGTKDIIAGPPQLVAQNLDITLFIGDALTNTIFSNVTFSLKGVGTNENKAFIEAFKTLNPKNKELLSFLEEGKSKIINYYASNCDFIVKDAETLVKLGKFDEAIYKLSLIPEVSQNCYFTGLDRMASIYQQKIDADCKVKFNEAKISWTASQTPAGAEKAGDILSTINPMAACQTEVSDFVKTIDAKLKADEKAKWQFKMNQYADKIASQKEAVRIAEEKGKRDDIYRENQSQRDAVLQEKQLSRNLELDKLRASSYREIALEQARNQPKTITYSKVYWR